MLMEGLLSGIVSSSTRVKLLVRIFANPKASSYLRGLSTELSLSTNSVREELNRLSKAHLVSSFKNGREVHYRANRDHPLFDELISIVQKVLGIDKITDHVINRLGKLEKALLIDDYALGKDTGIIDLVLVGEIDQNNLVDVVAKAEKYVKRKIRTLTLRPDEYDLLAEQLLKKPYLVLWESSSGVGTNGQAARSGTGG